VVAEAAEAEAYSAKVLAASAPAFSGPNRCSPLLSRDWPLWAGRCQFYAGAALMISAVAGRRTGSAEPGVELRLRHRGEGLEAGRLRFADVEVGEFRGGTLRLRSLVAVTIPPTQTSHPHSGRGDVADCMNCAKAGSVCAACCRHAAISRSRAARLNWTCSSSSSSAMSTACSNSLTACSGKL
jgi:hypothetical protein